MVRPSVPKWVEWLVVALLALASGIYLDSRRDSTAQASDMGAVKDHQAATDKRVDEYKASTDKRLDRLEDKVDDLIKIESWSHGMPNDVSPLPPRDTRR